MYSIGEVVLYGSNGVCEITEITTKKIGKDSIEYYVLKPVCSDSSTLFVPTQNEMLVQHAFTELATAAGELDVALRADLHPVAHGHGIGAANALFENMI